jgi:HK97 family phage prohead protease
MLHVIIGPPCAGKSTYVREHAREGDVRIDYDAIAQALGAPSSHGAEGSIRECAFRVREEAIGYAIESKCEAWVIHTSPTDAQLAAYEEAGAEFVELDTDMETCLQRAEEDGRPEGTQEVIRAYFEGKKSMDKHIKAAPDAAQVDGGSVKGYASTFDRDPDAYGDVVAPGAFAESLKRWEESGKPIPLLYGHNTDDPEYNIGAVTLAREDERGLYIEADFDPENPKAQYVRKLVQEGRLYQFSFAYDVLDAAEVTLEDGRKANELRKMELFEVSLVQIPANQHAEVVEVKSATKSGRRNSAKDADELRRIASMASDIQEVVNGLLADEAPEEPDEPNAEEPTQANAEEAVKDHTALIDEADKLIKSIEEEWA